MPDRQKLVYDWNLIGESEPLTDKRVLLDDETLRDGLQYHRRLARRGAAAVPPQAEDLSIGNYGI